MTTTTTMTTTITMTTAGQRLSPKPVNISETFVPGTGARGCERQRPEPRGVLVTAARCEVILFIDNVMQPTIDEKTGEIFSLEKKKAVSYSIK